ncbi:hypothetical protein K488DRAFT_48684 [Vararia minispora EC-137]|uniref:Uncharacterized protein n=1 Tax=Vararia minispora EC-137 TaxID=1314806 RepID=A0ACB8QNN4_9AGAM|nr:hypothetical protein K488DRAFT_48684 [Vararia minispora EC-137]
MAIDEVDAELLGVYLLCMTYGVYLVVFYHCVVAFWRRGFGNGTWWLPAATLLIFVTANIHMVSALVRAWQAFHFQPHNALAPEQVFRHVASLPALIKNGAFIAQTILTDGIMVYRTYIIWSHFWLVLIIPIGALCADFAMGTWSMYTLARTGVDGDPIVADVVVRVRYFYVVTLVLNVVCCGLIAYKIWNLDAARRSVDSDVRNRSAGRLGRVVTIIVESAAVYCAALIVLIITSAWNSDVMFPVLDMMPPLMATIFSLIIIRVFRGTSVGMTAHSTTLGTMRFGRGPRPVDSDDRCTIDEERSVPLDTHVTEIHFSPAPMDSAIDSMGSKV